MRLLRQRSFGLLWADGGMVLAALVPRIVLGSVAGAGVVLSRTGDFA